MSNTGNWAVDLLLNLEQKELELAAKTAEDEVEETTEEKNEEEDDVEGEEDKNPKEDFAEKMKKAKAAKSTPKTTMEMSIEKGEEKLTDEELEETPDEELDDEELERKRELGLSLGLSSGSLDWMNSNDTLELGAQPGHDFYGNQFTSGSTGSTADKEKLQAKQEANAAKRKGKGSKEEQDEIEKRVQDFADNKPSAVEVNKAETKADNETKKQSKSSSKDEGKKSNNTNLKEVSDKASNSSEKTIGLGGNEQTIREIMKSDTPTEHWRAKMYHESIAQSIKDRFGGKNSDPDIKSHLIAAKDHENAYKVKGGGTSRERDYSSKDEDAESLNKAVNDSKHDRRDMKLKVEGGKVTGVENIGKKPEEGKTVIPKTKTKLMDHHGLEESGGGDTFTDYTPKGDTLGEGHHIYMHDNGTWEHHDFSKQEKNKSSGFKDDKEKAQATGKGIKSLHEYLSYKNLSSSDTLVKDAERRAKEAKQ